MPRAVRFRQFDLGRSIGPFYLGRSLGLFDWGRLVWAVWCGPFKSGCSIGAVQLGRSFWPFGWTVRFGPFGFGRLNWAIRFGSAHVYGLCIDVQITRAVGQEITDYVTEFYITRGHSRDVRHHEGGSSGPIRRHINRVRRPAR